MKNDSQLNLIHKLIINILNINTKLKKRIKRLIDKKKIGSFEFRMNINALERMYYAYICYNSAKLAKQLGKKKNKCNRVRSCWRKGFINFRGIR